MPDVQQRSVYQARPAIRITLGAAAGCIGLISATAASAADCVVASGALETVQPCDMMVNAARADMVPEAPRSISITMTRRAAAAANVRDRTRRGAIADGALVADVARRWRIDPHLLAAMVRAESGGNRVAVSNKGALGLMQVMPATARSMGVANPTALLSDPRLALETGAAYLKTLQSRLGNNVPLIVAAYNAGPGAVKKAGMQVPAYRETQAYVGKVMTSYVAARGAARIAVAR